MGCIWNSFANYCDRIFVCIKLTFKAVESYVIGDDPQVRARPLDHGLSTDIMLHNSIQSDLKGPSYKDGNGN